MDILTQSRLRAARACMRLHHYQFDEGFQEVRPPGTVRFGTLFHAGLEAWWRSHAKLPRRPPDRIDSLWKEPVTRLAEALEAVRAKWDGENWFDLVKAEVLLTGYELRWGDEPLNALAVEAEFRGPLRNPATGSASRTWRLGGKIDVIVEEIRYRSTKIMEHKTSSEDISPGSEYWRRLRMDGQVSQYFEGAKLLGYPVDGCIYDVIGKPALRPLRIPLVDGDGIKIVKATRMVGTYAVGDRIKTADGKRWRQTGDTELGFVVETREETPEEFRIRLADHIAENPDRYYQRGDVVRLEQDVREAQFDTWQMAQTIAAAKKAGAFPRNQDSCVRYGRTCEFFDVCTGAASLDDRTRFVKLGPTPELSGTSTTTEELL